MVTPHTSDPRITGDYLRRFPGGLTLIGVVHDHPASVYRVRELVGAIDPDVLALELAPLSIPLFEQYAQSNRTPPVFGGEMSAAIQAASTDTVVGIDRPAGGFFRRLLATLFDERPTPSIARRVISSAVSTSKHAIICRLAGAIAARTSIRLEVDSPIEHETDWVDPPSEQALNERTQIRQSQAFMNAFQTASRTQAARVGDAARERHMAARLSALAGDGDVVAVVGISHLESLPDLLVSE